jgi:hypothetical protein
MDVLHISTPSRIKDYLRFDRRLQGAAVNRFLARVPWEKLVSGENGVL